MESINLKVVENQELTECDAKSCCSEKLHFNITKYFENFLVNRFIFLRPFIVKVVKNKYYLYNAKSSPNNFI